MNIHIFAINHSLNPVYSLKTNQTNFFNSRFKILRKIICNQTQFYAKKNRNFFFTTRQTVFLSTMLYYVSILKIQLVTV